MPARDSRAFTSAEIPVPPTKLLIKPKFKPAAGATVAAAPPPLKMAFVLLLKLTTFAPVPTPALKLVPE